MASPGHNPTSVIEQQRQQRPLQETRHSTGNGDRGNDDDDDDDDNMLNFFDMSFSLMMHTVVWV